MRRLSIVSLIVSLALAWMGLSHLSFSITHHFADTAQYEQVYKPFVLVSVQEGDEELRRGSGFLIRHVEDGVCRVFAVTNHHVVYGTEALASDENVPDIGDIGIVVEFAHRVGQKSPEVHLADPVRTSRFADLSLLLVPALSCMDTFVAEIENEDEVRVGDSILHMTASGAESGNVEMIPGYVTRLGVDPMGHKTMSTTVMIISGMSGSPVFTKTWTGYKVVGIVKGHFTLDGINNAGTNYIATAEELRILVGK
jgi:S1-C subfamily serine protease